MAQKILVVEDDHNLRSDLVSYLQLKGYTSLGAASCREVEELLAEHDFAAIILDIGLPDGDGRDLVERIRATRGLNTGIIMLTAYGAPEHRVDTLDKGADAFLVKHTSLREIDATLRSVLRRLEPEAAPMTTPCQPAPAPAGDVETAGWRLDRLSWTLTDPSGTSVQLTTKEMSFLAALAEYDGRVCERAELVARMDGQGENSNRNLDVIVRRLRRKIEDATGQTPPIRVAYGQGYAFAAPLIMQS